MKQMILAAMCIAILSTGTDGECKLNLKLGAKIPANCLALEGEELKLLATHPGQLRPFIERIVRKVKYAIAYDEKTHRIKYIHTVDQAFRTANGLHVGSQIKVTREQVSGGFGGWYTFGGRTSDGWDIIIPDVDSDDWESDEIRTVMVSGFKKGGN